MASPCGVSLNRTVSLIFILAIPTSKSPAPTVPLNLNHLAEDLFRPAIVVTVVVADQKAALGLLGNQMSIYKSSMDSTKHDIPYLVIILLPIGSHHSPGR